jgi:O-antigen ligase
MSAQPADMPASRQEQQQRTDAFFTKGLIVLLLISFSSFRLHLLLGKGTRHESIYYLDLPLLLLISLITLGYRTLDPRPLGLRLRVFAPLFALTAWWLLSGFFMAYQRDFFAASILQYISGCLALLALPRLMIRHKLVEFSMDAFLAVASVVALGALIYVGVRPENAFENVTSTLNPNRSHIGLYMLLALTMAFYRAQRTGLAARYLSLAFLFFCVILLSGSRAALVGCLLVLAAYFMRRLTFGNFLKFALAAALLFGVFSYIMERREGVARTARASQFEISENVTVDQSAGRRLLMWYGAYRTLQSSDAIFWRGIGFTNYRWNYDKVVKLPFYTNAAHNVYLHVWVETGLIGLILYLLVFICLVGYVFRHRKRDPALLLLGGMVVGVCFTGMTQETLFPNEAQSNFNVLFFFMTALVIIDSQLRMSAASANAKAVSSGAEPPASRA